MIFLNLQDNLMRLEIVGPPVSLAVIPTPGSKVSVNDLACEDGYCEWSALDSAPIRLTTAVGSVLQLVLDLPSGTTGLASFIEVDQLRFWEARTVADGIQLQSGVRKGEIRFLATPDSSYVFLNGEVLQVEPEYLILRSITYASNRIDVQFSGKVKDIETQIGTSSASIKPNLLEALSRVPSVKIGIAIITFMFGAGYTLRRALNSGN